MATKTLIVGVLMGALALSGCMENTAGASGSASINSLATRGNLSPDAIRLQTSTMQLVSLEEQQRAARQRVGNFQAQGAAIGAVGGALVGALGCALAGCSDSQRNQAMLIGAGGGGALGYQQGGAQAQRQNTAAAAENAILERLKIAGQQLDTARTARGQAERVAVQHQRKLATLKTQVQSGQASKETLELARADAAADAAAIGQASGALDKSVVSVKDETRLANQQNGLTREEQATAKSYDALVSSIKSSAL